MKFHSIRDQILRSAGKHPYRFGMMAATPLVGLALAAGPVLDAGAATPVPRTVPVNHAVEAGTVAAAPAGAAQAPVGAPAGQLVRAAQPAPVPAKPAPAVPVVPDTKGLPFSYERQTTYYYCGPASTRIAASAIGKIFSQDAMAQQLGTTESGTNSAADVTRVLNSLVGGSVYHTTEIPGQAGPAQVAQLRTDIVRAISGNRAAVANIVGVETDTTGQVHDYSGGHYVAIVGYGANGNGIMIADPADPVGDGTYWVSADTLANWMSTRGYSS